MKVNKVVAKKTIGLRKIKFTFCIKNATIISSIKATKRNNRRRGFQMEKDYTFEKLSQNIQLVHEVTSVSAKSAVNQMLTVRNWVIGYYIVEFEQNGQRRSEYGSHLLSDLEHKLSIKGLDRSMLNVCRSFYLKYPQICDSVNNRLNNMRLLNDTIGKQIILPNSTLVKNQICDSMNHKFEMDAEILISKLSFTHIRELITIDDAFERFFYELECIKGTWSVRELKRQISTNLYVRA